MDKKDRERLAQCTVTLEQMEFSVRTINCLNKANIKTVGDLIQLSPLDYFKMRNCGPKMRKEIKEKLMEIEGVNLNLDICNLNEQVRVLERHVEDLRSELEVAKIEWGCYLQPFKDIFKVMAKHQENKW